MSILFLDFESYYDDEYSLKKMAPPNYILDPRWETIGLAARFEGDASSTFIDGPDVARFLAGINPANTTTVAFNALFDNCVLAWRYGFVPARMVCTMRLAVALRGHELPGHSLAVVGERLGVGHKGSTIQSVKGMHRTDILANVGLWRAYQAYANNDNEMNREIFYKLMPELPTSERRIMDRVIRCAVEPKFVVNQQMLREHLVDLRRDKIEMLLKATDPKAADVFSKVRALAERPGTPSEGTVALAALERLEARHAGTMDTIAKTLRSNVKFAEVLRANNIEIEYKPSVTNPDVQVPAFAKTDEFMSKLLDHEDPAIQALATARLGLRSTIEETRGARILSIGELEWPSYCDGNMPIPLKYAAAHTHRLGGEWSINAQNLPSGRGQQVSKLRKALEAREGFQVVVADKSQVECRINGYICGQQDLLAIFAANGDPYSVLASGIFNMKVDKNVHKLERFIGKSGVLGLGFGCGADKFYTMVVRSARLLGMDMAKLLQVWTPDLAQRSVGVYRSINGNIVRAWRTLNSIIATAWVSPGSTPVRFGPVTIGYGYVEGPGGLRMNYGKPSFDPEADEYYYTYGTHRHKMYGSKLLENIVQFLARINTMHDALRISDRGYRFVLQSHDELAWIVPDDKVADCQAIALEEMRRPPSWAPRLPLNAECSFGRSYGDAK